MKYTFQHNDGEHTTVEAESEAKARDLAMFQRWGFPDRYVLFSRPYQGYGLSLVGVAE